MIDSVKKLSDARRRYCFILGAGASVSSGIPTAIQLANDWLKELLKLEPKVTKKWIKENKVNKNNIDRFYSEIYKMRFCAHPREGYVRLQNIMENAKPGFGYYNLANILATDKTPINFVITTNFDRLIEEAIFMYTDKKPMIVTHEQLAHYINDLGDERPIIAKIHRDIMLHPRNTRDETMRLAKSWKSVLMRALSAYTPIVMGYNGNDGSLMRLLENFVEKNGKTKPIYWCYLKKDGQPKNKRIIRLLNKCGGFLVPIINFDVTMYMFGIGFGHSFSEESLEKQLQQKNDDYREQRKKTKVAIEHDLENTENNVTLTNAEKRIKNVVLQYHKKEIKELTEKIKKTPKIAKRYYYRGIRYLWLDKFEKALKDFSMAITLEPNNAENYYYRGITYGWLNKVKKALADQKMAVTIADGDDKLAEYYNAIGINYDKLKKYNKAVVYHRKAIKLNPRKARYRAWLSYPLYKVEGKKNALNTIYDALKENNEEPMCYSNRGLIYLKIDKEAGKKPRARVLKNFNKALKLEIPYRRYRCYTDFAEYYLYVGKLNKARKYLELARKGVTGKQYGRVMYYLAKYHKKKGNIKKYKRYMTKSKKMPSYP